MNRFNVGFHEFEKIFDTHLLAPPQLLSDKLGFWVLDLSSYFLYFWIYMYVYVACIIYMGED